LFNILTNSIFTLLSEGEYTTEMKFLYTLKAKIPLRLKIRLKDSKVNYFRLWLTELHMIVRPPRYFGQTAEDVILRIYLPESKGSYIDIGAGRPITYSNTFAFYRRGWKGVCVDPISTNTKLLKSFRRNDQVLNILIGEKEEDIDFWEFDPYHYSTAEEAVALKVQDVLGLRLHNFSKKAVRPLSSIAPKCSGFDASLLSIDVEGFDLVVLKSNDWQIYHPRVICVEEWEKTMDENFNSEIAGFLANHGYKRMAWTGLSSIFVDKSYLASLNKT